MKMINKFKLHLLSAVLLAGAAACDDDIEVGKAVDETPYNPIARIDGMLLDATSNRSERVIELRATASETAIYFSMTKLPARGST